MKYARAILFIFLVIPISSAFAEDRTFDSLYEEAEQRLVEKNYGAFGDLTANLIKLREDDGYANLVPLSDHLIEAGRAPCGQKDSNCSFFVKSAVLLSPKDPWTLFSAATLAPSFKESASLFSSALKNSRNSPTFFFKGAVVFGVCLLALISLYVVLKLLFGVVRFEMDKISPRGILTFAILSLIGLPFGLISTGVCWSAIILLFVGRKKEIVQLLLLTLAWIAFLPTAENMVKFVSRPEEREIELLLSRVASPSSGINAPDYLNEPLYLGTKYFREGNFVRAKEQFLLAKSADAESNIVSLARLSASELALKQFAEAKLSIANTRAQGLNSYESVHNEAMLAASTTNLNDSRLLLDKLKEIDKDRLSKASLSTGILLEPVSLGAFADRYLEPIEKHLHSAPPALQWISSDRMIKPLCTLGLAGLLVLSAVMAGLLIVPAHKLRRLV